MKTTSSKEVRIEARAVYGCVNLYVVSEHAEAVRALTGKKTVSHSDMQALEALGFTLLVVPSVSGINYRAA